MNKSFLSVLALIAAALSTSPADHVARANLVRRSEKLRKDEGIADDSDEAKILGAVVRAAETADVSADATLASDLSKEHLADESELTAQNNEQEQGNASNAGSEVKIAGQTQAPAARTAAAPDASDATARNIDGQSSKATADQTQKTAAPAAATPAKAEAPKQAKK